MKSTTPKTRRAQKPPTASTVFNISGSNNVTAGGDVHIHEANKSSTALDIRPGVDHLSIEQRAVLRKLVEQIAETEARLKKRPRGYAAVYSSLFRQFPEVTALEAIPLDGFELARTFLNTELGRLNSMKTAPIKNADDWRKRRYAYIKVNSKAPEDATALTRYIKRNFGAESLTELSNDELEKTYRYVASRRNKKR